MQTNDKSLTRKAFWAMVHRDLLVQWRDKWEFVFRVAMIPVLILILLLTAAESAALGLLDPLTWINEAIRALMTPSTPSLPLAVSAIGMVVWTAVMGLVAMKRFNKMVYNK